MLLDRGIIIDPVNAKTFTDVGDVGGGAAAGQDGDSDASQQQMSDSRSGFEDEQERMERQSGEDTRQGLQSRPKQRRLRP